MISGHELIESLKAMSDDDLMEVHRIIVVGRVQPDRPAEPRVPVDFAAIICSWPACRKTSEHSGIQISDSLGLMTR